MPRYKTALTVIAHRCFLIDTTLIIPLILAHLRNLITRVVSIAGRGVDAGDVVDCLENLGLRSPAQHVAIDFLLSPYFIGERRDLATRATTCRITRILLRAVGVGDDQRTALPIVRLEAQDPTRRVVAAWRPAAIDLRRIRLLIQSAHNVIDSELAPVSAAATGIATTD